MMSTPPKPLGGPRSRARAPCTASSRIRPSLSPGVNVTAILITLRYPPTTGPARAKGERRGAEGVGEVIDLQRAEDRNHRKRLVHQPRDRNWFAVAPSSWPSFVALASRAGLPGCRTDRLCRAQSSHERLRRKQRPQARSSRASAILDAGKGPRAESGERGSSRVGCNEGRHAMRRRVSVRRSDPRSGPMARAQVAHLAAFHVWFQRIHHLVHRSPRIIAMKKVQIDIVGSEPLEALLHVARDHLGTRDTYRDEGNAAPKGDVPPW